MTDKLEALRRTALFGGLDAATLGALAARAVERRYGRDEVLFLTPTGSLPLAVLFRPSKISLRKRVLFL
jgi:hypothetical protein